MKASKSFVLHIVFLSVFSYFFTSASAQPMSTSEIIKKSISAVSAINNGSYKIKFAQKYLDRKDTFYISGQCVFRKENAIQLGAKLNILQQENGIRHIYNGKEILLLTQKDSTALIINTKKHGYGYIKGNTASNLIFNAVIKESIKNILTDTDIDTIILSEEILNNQTPCYVLKIKYKGNAETKNNTLVYYINKETFIPIRRISNLDWQNQHQYLEHNIYDIKVNTLSAQDDQLFERTAIPDYFKHKIYTPEPEIRPLAAGKTAPDWELENIQGHKISSNKLKGKIVVLDFSYKACYYCKKLLPDLQKVKDKYADANIEFLIINPFDTSLAEYTTYLQEQNIDIPALKGTKEIIKAYNILAYPTLYIVDEKGKIASCFVRFVPEKTQLQIEKTIQKLLKANKNLAKNE